MDPESPRDPVVRTFMQLQMERKLDYSVRIEEIGNQIRELRLKGLGNTREEDPGTGILAFGKWCIEWYQGKHTHDKYYKEPEGSKDMKRDTVDMRLNALIESGRKLTVAHFLIGGARYVHTKDTGQSDWLLLADEQLGAMHGKDGTRGSSRAQKSAGEFRDKGTSKSPPREKDSISSGRELVREEGAGAVPVIGDAERWNEAARRYQEGVRQDAEREEENERAIRVAGEQLEVFVVSSQGAAARKLLEASGRVVVFARTVEFGYAMMWCFDNRGLSKWLLVDGRPTWNELRAEEAVEVAFRKNRRSVPPTEFMSWLRSKVDSIAEGVITEGVENLDEAKATLVKEAEDNQ